MGSYAGAAPYARETETIPTTPPRSSKGGRHPTVSEKRGGEKTENAAPTNYLEGNGEHSGAPLS